MPGNRSVGYYLPPFAYAYMQILGQAVAATGGLDQGALADHIRSHEFETVVGKIRFGRNGEWARPRVLMVQFQGIADNRLETFSEAGTRVVLHPPEWRSGDLIAPFARAR